jgi:creatinine amidohydrolase
MKRCPTMIVVLCLCSSAAFPQSKPAAKQASRAPLVELDMMTGPELKKAIHEDNKTTALVYNGGTEQRGPQNVNGGHNFMGRATVRAIAEKLGNAIAAPVLPYSVNNANPDLPGTIGLTGPLFAAVNEQVAEQLIKNGFKNVVLMGDHAGGQQELKQVAIKLDEKYLPQGVRVVYCDDVYTKATEDFNTWMAANGYPPGTHASIPDTSEMLYLGGDKAWVRKELLATALGDPPVKPGEKPDPNIKRVNNGITGDARRSSAELGKRVFDMKVEYAVKQIHHLLAESAGSSRPAGY